MARTAEQKMADIAFIRNPDRWPNWPFLTLTRSDKHRNHTGILAVATTGNDDGNGNGNGGKLVVIYLVNYFSYIKGGIKLKDCAKMKYDSVEEMIEDGWRVD